MAKSDKNTQNRLKQLCEKPPTNKALLPFHTIQGIVFAVSSAPEIPMPEVWLPWVINKRKQLTSEQQADELTDLLMHSLQQQLKAMRDDEIQLPKGVTYEGDTSITSPLAQWCQGVLLGHSQLESVWKNAWNKMRVTEQEAMRQLQKDVSHCLYMFSTFADVPLAIEQAKQRGNDQLENVLPKIFLSFSITLEKYVGLSGRLVDFLPNQFETFEK